MTGDRQHFILAFMLLGGSLQAVGTTWARLRWGKIEALAPLADFGLHEARHTFASLMIDAGVNAKALTEYMGHSSITITFDRYGHLMPGSHEQAAALLDAYLGGSP